MKPKKKNPESGEHNCFSGGYQLQTSKQVVTCQPVETLPQHWWDGHHTQSWCWVWLWKLLSHRGALRKSTITGVPDPCSFTHLVTASEFRFLCLIKMLLTIMGLLRCILKTHIYIISLCCYFKLLKKVFVWLPVHVWVHVWTLFSFLYLLSCFCILPKASALSPLPIPSTSAATFTPSPLCLFRYR